MSMDLVLNKNFYNYVGVMLFSGVYTSGNAGEAQLHTPYAAGLGYSVGASNAFLKCDFTDINDDSITDIWCPSPQSRFSAYNFSLFSYNVTNASYALNVTFNAGSDNNTAATVNSTSLILPNSNITATVLLGERDTYTSMIYTVQFSSQTSQTLGEVGFNKDVILDGNYTTKTIMLGRCVLDDDIPLDSEHSVTLQIRLSLPIPA